MDSSVSQIKKPQLKAWQTQSCELKIEYQEQKKK
jgi:hypothetical protein